LIASFSKLGGGKIQIASNRMVFRAPEIQNKEFKSECKNFSFAKLAKQKPKKKLS